MCGQKEREAGLHEQGRRVSKEVEMRASEEGESKSKVPGEAKRGTGLKREAVSYAQCSRGVSSEKFRHMTLHVAAWRSLMTLTTLSLVGPWVGRLIWGGWKRGCEVGR